MDTNLIYLFYLLVLGLLAALIWILMRQRNDAHDPHGRMGRGHDNGGHPKLDEFSHQPVEENGDE